MAPRRSVGAVIRKVLTTILVVSSALALAACSEDASWAGAQRTADPSATDRAWDHAAGERVTLIGDSIMRGHGLARQQAWPAVLGSREHWQVTNLACDGAGFLAEGDDDQCGSTFAGLVDRVADTDPQVVIVQGSSNDLGQDDDELAGETTQQLAELHRAVAHARIIGLSAIWNEQQAPAQLATISEQVQAAVTAVGGTSVDIGEPLRGHAGWMQSDDVHPTATGQRAIADAVAAAFRRDHVRF